MLSLVILHRAGPDWDPNLALEAQSGWIQHASFMDGLVDAGFIVLGGPLSDEYRVVHASRRNPRRRSAKRSRTTRGAAPTW